MTYRSPTFNRAYPEAAWWAKIIGWVVFGPVVIAYAVVKWAVQKVMARRR